MPDHSPIAPRLLAALLGLGLILGLLVVDHLVFAAWFGVNHLRWYLAAGVGISLVTSVASIAWGDLERHTGLISPHPLDYLGSCLQLVGLPIHALGTHLRRKGGERSVGAALDALLAVPLVLLLVVALFLWLVVIGPPQYFVHLVCGAPARTFARSAQQPIAQVRGTQVVVDEVASAAQIPEGWWTGGLARRPIATTTLFAALVLLVVRPMLG